MIIGVSACRKCGLVADLDDFIYNPWNDNGWEAADDPSFEGLQ